MNYLIERWKAKTPKAWKQIQKEAIVAGVSLTAVWVANNTLNLNLDGGTLAFVKYGIAACSFIAGRAQFKTENSQTNG